MTKKVRWKYWNSKKEYRLADAACLIHETEPFGINQNNSPRINPSWDQGLADKISKEFWLLKYNSDFQFLKLQKDKLPHLTVTKENLFELLAITNRPYPDEWHKNISAISKKKKITSSNLCKINFISAAKTLCENNPGLYRTTQIANHPDVFKHAPNARLRTRQNWVRDHVCKSKPGAPSKK